MLFCRRNYYPAQNAFKFKALQCLALKDTINTFYWYDIVKIFYEVKKTAAQRTLNKFIKAST